MAETIKGERSYSVSVERSAVDVTKSYRFFLQSEEHELFWEDVRPVSVEPGVMRFELLIKDALRVPRQRN